MKSYEHRPSRATESDTESGTDRSSSAAGFLKCKLKYFIGLIFVFLLAEDHSRLSEKLGIRQGMATVGELSGILSETFSEITACEEAYAKALGVDYPPHVLKKKLGSFMTWYLGCGELLSPSFLHSISGMHYAPISKHCLPSMLQCKYGLEDAVGRFYKGSTFLYNGQISFCDMDNEKYLSFLYNYIRLKEGFRITSAATREFSSSDVRTEDYIHDREKSSTSEEKMNNVNRFKRMLSLGKRSSSNTNEAAKKSERAIEEWVNVMLNGRGFINKAWNDSEDFESLISDNSIPSHEINVEKELWSPKYLSPFVHSHDDVEENKANLEGTSDSDRTILYRHGRFLVIIQVLPEALQHPNILDLLRHIQEYLSSSLPALCEAIENHIQEIIGSEMAKRGPSTSMVIPQTPNSRDRPSGLIGPQVRIFYANSCVEAIKISGSKVWTPTLPKSSPKISSRNEFKNKVDRVIPALNPESLFQDQLLYFAVTQASMLTDASEHSNDEINAILELSATGAYKFANSPSHTAGYKIFLVYQLTLLTYFLFIGIM